ncbi:MAG: hypothetical protein ACK55I_25445 [bacterium]
MRIVPTPIEKGGKRKEGTTVDSNHEGSTSKMISTTTRTARGRKLVSEMIANAFPPYTSGCRQLSAAVGAMPCAARTWRCQSTAISTTVPVHKAP